MRVVKIQDLHKLLDLVDEVSEKTELQISLGFTTFPRKDKCMAVCCSAYEDEGECQYVCHDGTEIKEPKLKRVFNEYFYVNDEVLADPAPYIRCRDYLENLIKEVKANE